MAGRCEKGTTRPGEKQLEGASDGLVKEKETAYCDGCCDRCHRR